MVRTHVVLCFCLILYVNVYVIQTILYTLVYVTSAAVTFWLK